MWQRALTYRFSVMTYRIGEMMEVLVIILMWSAIYGGQNVIKGYTLDEMVSYILIGNIIDVIVRNWMAGKVGEEIKNGYLSLFLIKPISYFWDMLFREVGRISLAIVVSVFSQIGVALFFIDKLIVNTDPLTLAVIVIMVGLAFITELLISFLIGLSAFWVDEMDGIFSTVNRLKKFLAGGYFPINLLPSVYVQASLLLPFAYSFFVPAQLYIYKMPLSQGMQGIAVQIIWIMLLFLMIKAAWKHGLKRYEGVGI